MSFSLKNIQKKYKNKFSKDIIINFISLFILSVSGILLNIVVMMNFEAQYLGIFNQALSIYVILSIISGFGMNTSILRYSSKFSDNKEKLSSIYTSSLFIVTLFSILISLISFLFLYYFKLSFISANLNKALLIILTGLPFFSISKVILGLFNGLRKIKLFSIFQAIRWILILLLTIIAVYFDKSIFEIIFIFPIVDLIIFIFLIIISLKIASLKLKNIPFWIKKHILFGFKTLLANSIDIINGKIDILMVGFLINDYYAGIYSSISIIARGLSMFAGVVQRNFNPLISSLWGKGDIEKLKTYLKKIKATISIIMLTTILFLAVFFIVGMNFFEFAEKYKEGIIPFYILLVGVGYSSFNFWASGLLAMTGFPGEFSKLMSLMLIINILGNLILIPILGINGAALATTIAYIVMNIDLKRRIKKIISIKI